MSQPFPFPPEWVTPRRDKLLRKLKRYGVEIATLNPDDPSKPDFTALRIYIPHDSDSVAVAFLLTELFDPSFRTPIQLVDSYPQCVKYALAEHMIGPNGEGPK